ncbi:MAG: dicarboxylate transporter, DctP subunit [Frankiales bacterium]|jgi:TRAP-type C4-dicarboxylate transport system substrate-binding protein|nr:dicarboxylate transporter, DctP subunit [Frankiales bacterium]
MRLSSRTALVPVVVAASLGLAACGGSGGDTAEAGQPLNIELATWGSPDHENIASFVPAFAKALDEASDGRITLEHLSGGAIAEDVDMPVAIPAGTVQMGWSTVNGWSGVVPAVKIFDSPALAVTPEQLAEGLSDAAGLGGVLRDKFEEKGARVLAFSDLGAGVIVGKKDIRVPDDLKGEDVRVFSEGGAKIVEAAAGAPASIAFAEVYTALQRGTVDAAHAGLQGVQSQQLQEVTTKGLVPANFFGTTMMGWIANADWWDGLDEADQEIITEAAQEAEQVARKALTEGRQALIDSYGKAGLEVFVLTPEDQEYSAWESLVEPLAEADRKSLDQDAVAALDELVGSS